MNKEKLIDGLKRIRIGLFNAKIDREPIRPYLDTAISALEAQQADRWIPIASGVLPEDVLYPPVICCNAEDNWTDAAVYTGKGYFINCEGIIIRPTHWRPLPKPWKEEQP